MPTDRNDAGMNSVWILDAVPRNEMQTARRLEEDLKDLKALDNDNIVRCKINSGIDLELTFQEMLRRVLSEGVLPWIHLDGHGNEQGFRTATGILIEWNKLGRLCSVINQQTNLQTVVILATCDGFSFASAMSPIPINEVGSNKLNRSPCVGFIGTINRVSAGEVSTDFPIFYRTFFEGKGLDKALAALPAGKYSHTSATQFFELIWSSHLKNAPKPKNHVRRLRRNAVKQGIASDVDQLPLSKLYPLLNEVRASLLTKSWTYFFFHDVYPENKNAFPIPFGTENP